MEKDSGFNKNKFEVTRTDGKSEKPYARYFILDYVNDPFARVALETYATAAFWDGFTNLANDLRSELSSTEGLGVEEETEEEI